MRSFGNRYAEHHRPNASFWRRVCYARRNRQPGTIRTNRQQRTPDRFLARREKPSGRSLPPTSRTSTKATLRPSTRPGWEGGSPAAGSIESASAAQAAATTATARTIESRASTSSAPRSHAWTAGGSAEVVSAATSAAARPTERRSWIRARAATGSGAAPNVIYLGPVPNQQILPALRWIVGFEGKKRWFLVGSDYVFPVLANAVIRDEAKARSCTIVGEEYLLLGSTVTAPPD